MFQEVACGLGPPRCPIPGCQHQPPMHGPNQQQNTGSGHMTHNITGKEQTAVAKHTGTHSFYYGALAAPARTASPATSPVMDAHLHPAPDNKKAPKPALENQQQQIPLLPAPRYMFWDLEFELSFSKTKAWFQVTFISIEVFLTQHTTGCTNF